MSGLSKPAEPVTDEDGWYSQRQASLVLGVSAHTVLSRALAGELVAKKIAGRWCFTRESVERALSNA